MNAALAGNKRCCGIVDLGRASYRSVHRLQEALVATRRAGHIDDVLLLVEHDPVITVGRSDDGQSLRTSRKLLARRAIEIVECERGGKATYHGPGQLVGYPIIDLRRGEIDLHEYLRRLEQVLIVALAGVGIPGYRREGMTGVWVANRKIAAIGIAVRNWVAFHGFALNVTCDLEPFEWIVPCGLAGVEITSVEEVSRKAVDMAVMSRLVAEAFCRVFEVEGYLLDGEELSQVVASMALGVGHG